MSGPVPPTEPGRLRASMLVIGDEILSGFVQDTNSGWIAQRLATLGVPLDRVVTVPDEMAAIGEALRTELARDRPRVVLTSGGIGSTPDDLTLESVAAELGMGMRIEPSIDARITQALAWTAAQGMTVSSGHERSMRKMARVPEQAYLLPAADGAPGVAVDVDGGVAGPQGATVVVLPGVPRELRWIMVRGVEPTLLEGRGVPLQVVEITHGYPESTLNPALDRIVEEFPDVALGSYPGRECVIRLRAREPERVEAAAALVRDFLGRLEGTDGARQIRERWRQGWDDRMRSDLTPQ